MDHQSLVPLMKGLGTLHASSTVSINQEEPLILTKIYPQNFFLLSSKRSREDPSSNENQKDFALMEKRHSISATLDPNHSTYQTYMAAGRGEIWFWFEKI
jgi:hypothetical protein